MEIRVLTGEDVRMALPMADAIEAMREAFGQFSSGHAVMPPRAHVLVRQYDGLVEFMPGYLPLAESLTIKTVSVYPHNRERGLPTVQALIIAYDVKTGRPAAILEGSSLTSIRTGAASGLATDLLARPDASVAAIFGSGAQARTQLEAICTVRQIERVWVYSLTRERAEGFARDMAGRGPIPKEILIAMNPGEAVAEAKIICTATTSQAPVFLNHELPAGAHVNAIGSFTPQSRELDSDLVARSLVVVDSRKVALAEAGELIIPIREGIVTADIIHAELGEIVNGYKPGRSDPDQTTIFKSVGLAIQDSAAASRILSGAVANSPGQFIYL